MSTTNSQVVIDFLEALEVPDTDRALALLDPEVAWLNTGLPTLRGKRVFGTLRDMDRRGIGFRADLHAVAADGDTVLTDRTDYLRVGPVETQFWVRGTFTVRGGLITRWDDAFGWGSLLGGTAVGALKALNGLRGRR